MSFRYKTLLLSEYVVHVEGFGEFEFTPCSLFIFLYPTGEVFLALPTVASTTSTGGTKDEKGQCVSNDWMHGQILLGPAKPAASLWLADRYTHSQAFTRSMTLQLG